MKTSRFNLSARIEGSGGRLLFNAASAALAEVDVDTWPAVQRLLEDPAAAGSKEDDDLLSALEYGGFLVDSGRDEVGVLYERHRRSRTANRTLLLTIAPTLACNFGCTYCFENQSPVRMSTEVEDGILSLVRRRLPESDEVVTTWFGGEPTLCVDLIERLQLRILGLAAEAGVEVKPASIITNGHRLDGELSRRLLGMGVRSAQVTLDGPPDVHDTRRPLRGGGGTYARILENLQEASAHLQIVVRVNVDTRNADRAPEVYESLQLAGVADRVLLYFAPVNEADGICADMKGRCFSAPQFARTRIQLYQRLLDRGITRIEYPDLAAGTHCGADSSNSFVIGPDGQLFRCWEDLSVGGEHSVGSVLTDEVLPRQAAESARYVNWDPFSKRDCPGCSVLPICMGGCPREGIQLDSPARGGCSSWKFNLEDMLRLRHRCEKLNAT